MHRFKVAKELRCVLAHRLGLLRINAIRAAGFKHGLPAVALELLMGRGARVLFGKHLRENAVAQAHRRIAKARRADRLPAVQQKRAPRQR